MSNWFRRRLLNAWSNRQRIACATVITLFAIQVLACCCCFPGTDSTGRDKEKAIPAPAPAEQPKPESDGKPSISIVRVRLVPFVTAQGQRTEKILVDWKNTGNRTVRIVDGTFTGHDDQGNKWTIARDYTIYAVFDDRPGVAPGETHIADETREGFILPPNDARKPTRATVEVTQASERGL